MSTIEIISNFTTTPARIFAIVIYFIVLVIAAFCIAAILISFVKHVGVVFDYFTKKNTPEGVELEDDLYSDSSFLKCIDLIDSMVAENKSMKESIGKFKPIEGVLSKHKMMTPKKLRKAITGYYKRESEIISCKKNNQGSSSRSTAALYMNGAARYRLFKVAGSKYKNTSRDKDDMISRAKTCLQYAKVMRKHYKMIP